MSEINDKRKDNRIQSYFTEYERKLIDAKREITGETSAQFVRRVIRLFLKGELLTKEK